LFFKLINIQAHTQDGKAKAKKPAWYVPNKEDSMPKIGDPTTAPKKVKVKVPPVAMLAFPAGAWRATSAK
jgi:hypothetical protein